MGRKMSFFTDGMIIYAKKENNNKYLLEFKSECDTYKMVYSKVVGYRVTYKN